MMTDAANLRDSTQITIPASAFDAVEAEVTGRFDVTVRREDRRVRIIASPVVIKDVGEFLARHGITVA